MPAMRKCPNNKQQEFLKQKERLKYVTHNHVCKKPIDADIMIEQLISDKETFKFTLEPELPYALPKWLKVQNNLVPALYEQIWQAVKLGPAYQYCDTQIITKLFTTSGLSLEKLGHLWSLTNVCSPGFLTQQELYVILALIALVQTGYLVKDISIIKSVHHPIIPQLDYTCLRITVANPAINKNVMKNPQQDFKSSNTILYNGFSCPSSSVPLEVKPLNSTSSSTLSSVPSRGLMNGNMPVPVDVPCSSNASTVNLQFPTEFVKDFNTNLTNYASEMRKSDVDVTFAIPELRNPDYDVDIFNISRQSTELDVDVPISNLIPAFTNPPVTHGERRFEKLGNSSLVNPPIPPLLQKPPTNGIRKLNLSSTSNFTSSTEPKSLDLPVFKNETPGFEDDEEFTEFQSATLPIVSEEYADFQSASPIVKFEFDNFMSNNSVDLKLNDNRSFKPNDVLEETDSSYDKIAEFQTSREADKYDVFRNLVQHEDEQPTKSESEEEEEDNKEEEDDFSDFHAAAESKPSKEQTKLSTKEKCLEACLRVLQEGLNVFSNITNESTIKEVLSDERGYKYFNQLKIVYETSQRFQRQFENVHLNDALQMTWAKLCSYTKYLSSEELLDDMFVGEEDVDASSCKLCETKCDVNCVRYAGNYYHVTCINLFLHFVEDAEISAMLHL